MRKEAEQLVNALRLDFVPWKAISEIIGVMIEGHESHPDEGWREMTAEQHIDHVYAHLTRYRFGDTSEDHLGHAVTRLAMALEVTRLNPQAQEEARGRIQAQKCEAGNE